MFVAPEPIEYIRRGKRYDARIDDDDRAYACGECLGIIGRNQNKARYHCGGYPCDDCWQPCEKGHYICQACRNKRFRAQQAVHYAKMDVILANDYDGPVYWDGQYFENINDAFEAAWSSLSLDDLEVRGKQIFHPCITIKLCLDPKDILEQALEEHRDDANDYLSDMAHLALATFCGYWNDRFGKDVETWLPKDNTRIHISSEWWELVDASAKDILRRKD